MGRQSDRTFFFACARACTHTRTRAHTHTHTHVCMHTYTRAYMCVHTHAHTYVHEHTHIYIYMMSVLSEEMNETSLHSGCESLMTESTKICTILYTVPYAKTQSPELINVNLKNIKLGS